MFPRVNMFVKFTKYYFILSLIFLQIHVIGAKLDSKCEKLYSFNNNVEFKLNKSLFHETRLKTFISILLLTLD